MSSDVHYIHVGGVSYLWNDICVYIDVPKLAQATTDSRSSSSNANENENENRDNVGESVGIDLKISVTNKSVSIKDGACSVSHVVWENVPKVI